MTLRHIRIFLAVCENDQNMTRAAEKLFLAQPAVSLAVRELEEYYGVPLFERVSRRLVLTEAGKRFREYAVHIDGLFSDLEDDLKNWDSAGVLRIGASITIGSQFLPCYARAFAHTHPGIDLQARISPSDELEQMLVKGELDLVLMEGLTHSPNLISEEYMEDSLVAICSPHGPFCSGERISQEVFQKQRLLLREPGSGTREVLEREAGKAGFSLRPAWEAMSTTALINAVIQGLGISVLPQRMVNQVLERGLAVPFFIEGMDFRRKYRMIVHKNKYQTPALKSFMELCRNYEWDYPLPKYSGLV